MAQMQPASKLLVFSDDWGRHPSSCQHLVRHLLPRYPTLWVNTLGMRRPTFSRQDLQKIWNRLRDWGRRPAPVKLPENLRIVAPRMWPGFRTPWQRRLNALSMEKAIRTALGAHPTTSLPVVAITTLPIVADLVGRLPVDRWIYYCVDDFSVWPGVDGSVMDAMERQLAVRVDQVIAVSQTLQTRLQGMGKTATLLTHGIDLDHWASCPLPSSQTLQPSWPSPTESAEFSARKNFSKPLPWWCSGLARPILLFWGLIDARLDVDWCRTLATESGGTLVLAGPTQSPPEALLRMAQARADAPPGKPGNLIMPGPVSYDNLPTLAAWADVLVMPYADLPVTRAMQPLKFKEYLAAGYPGACKPVVARALPALADWADAADLVDHPQEALALVRQRCQEGLPWTQQAARGRLRHESWQTKALELESMMHPPQAADSPMGDRKGA